LLAKGFDGLRAGHAGMALFLHRSRADKLPGKVLV
jgi:hypothetical protein